MSRYTPYKCPAKTCRGKQFPTPEGIQQHVNHCVDMRTLPYPRAVELMIQVRMDVKQVPELVSPQADQCHRELNQALDTKIAIGRDEVEYLEYNAVDGCNSKWNLQKLAESFGVEGVIELADLFCSSPAVLMPAYTYTVEKVNGVDTRTNEHSMVFALTITTVKNNPRFQMFYMCPSGALPQAYASYSKGFQKAWMDLDEISPPTKNQLKKFGSKAKSIQLEALQDVNDQMPGTPNPFAFACGFMSHWYVQRVLVEFAHRGDAELAVGAAAVSLVEKVTEIQALPEKDGKRDEGFKAFTENAGFKISK